MRPSFCRCDRSPVSSVAMVPLVVTMMILLLLTMLAMTGAQKEVTVDELAAMSDEQLEEICVGRGFHLVKDEKDPETGEVFDFTHEDYIEAAQRCLVIEKELNELLTGYPELAEQLEEELKMMEAENAAKRAELEELQGRLKEAQRTEDGSNSAAFVSTMRTNPRDVHDIDALFSVSSSEDPSLSSNNQDEFTIKPEDDEASIESTVEDDDEASNDLLVKDDGIIMKENDRLSSETNETITDLESKASSSSKDFTMAHLAIESLRAFVQHAKDDVNRLIGLMIPVIQPLLSAGDVAWRQIKALFLKAREAYETETHTDEAASDLEVTEDNE